MWGPLVRPRLPAHRWPSSHCIHTAGRGGSPFHVPSTRALMPLERAPPYDLITPKGPTFKYPHMHGFSFPHRDLGDTRSVHSSGL